MGPGHTAFTRILSAARRRARLFTKPTTPNLHIEYTGLNPEPTNPDVDAVKRRLPPPRARISGMAASVVISTVRRFRSTARSKAFMSMPSTAAGPGWPTWFQTKSRPLKRRTVSHTIRRESSSFVRSAAMPCAVPPAAVISSTTRCAPAASTSTTSTCAPSRAKRRAPARPMPEAAAVTIPIFPARRIASGASDPGNFRAHVHGGLAGRERRAPHQVVEGAAGLVVPDQLLRVEDHPDGIRGEVRARQVRVGLVHGGEDVDLQLHAQAVGVAIVHGNRRPVVDAPCGLDAGGLEPPVGRQELAQAGVGVGDVVHAGGGWIRGRTTGVVDDGHSMVLVVVGEKGDEIVAEGHARLQHGRVPGDHRVEIRGLEPIWANFCGA